jgi:hypothetical protein
MDRIKKMSIDTKFYKNHLVHLCLNFFHNE